MSPEDKNFNGSSGYEEEDYKKEENYRKDKSHHDGDRDDKNPGDDFFNDDDFEFVDYDKEEHAGDGYRIKRIKERRKRKRLILSTILIMAVLTLVATGIVFGYRFIKNKYFSKGEISEEESIAIPQLLQLEQDVNIVIAGARENLLEPEINSILFTNYNSSREELVSLHIPTKTLMEIPGFGLESVDQSVKYGGMDLMRLTLENGLGMGVDHHVLIDVYSVVNKLDGIEIKLDEPVVIKGSDNSEEELKQGVNLINGKTAVNFLLYFSGIRSDVPIENILRQRLIINSIIKEIAGENEKDLSSNLALVKNYIDTDISDEELYKLIATFSEVEAEKNKSFALDVTSVELEGSIFYVPDISRVSEIFAQEETAEEKETVTGETVSLVVLNGAGTHGLAAGVSDILMNLKYENGKDKYSIVKIGNADSTDYNNTEIIVNSGEAYVTAAAENIKDVLKAGNISVKEEVEAESDIIIILGRDYNYEPLEDEESEVPDETIKINVLNGEGTSKLAATVAGLISEHFNAQEKVLEVVETKDADNFDYTQTEIIYFTSRDGVEELARQIQEFLGAGVIRSSQDNVDNVDITIILGSDYTKK